MKQPIILAVLGIGLMLVAFFWRSNKTEVATNGDKSSWFSGITSGSQDQDKADSPAVSTANLSPDEKATVEQNSLRSMMRTMLEYSQANPNMNNLVEELNRSGQKPYIARDKNPYTGEMAIIRTKSPLPGTRYFHAQYFSDGNGGPGYFQHMSFEFRPGPKAMNEAMDAVYATFPNIGKPGLDRGDFKEWKLNTGYTVWIKKLDAEDIKQGDPFNAYTSADVGVIRVAIEEDPHPQGEEHEQGQEHEGHNH